MGHISYTRARMIRMRSRYSICDSQNRCSAAPRPRGPSRSLRPTLWNHARLSWRAYLLIL
eukprot:6188422-Pleurochrysis_carterae.AAC.1